MTRHHVISTTGCDVFYALVTHYRDNLGARFDSMVVTYSDGGKPVLGATLRNAKSGCEMHRRAGQAGECWCCGYDEQLEFVSQNGVPLAHAAYRLSVSNGETWTGTTDGKGCTERITSKQEAQITRAEFFPQADKSPCCTASPTHAKAASKTVELQDVKTTDKDVGSSVRKVTVTDKVRPLTKGEIDMAWMVFEDAIDYGKVKVHAEPYLWFGLQPKDVAMTPNGEIYFHELEFKEDFSKEDARQKKWFIHEMVHVWQFQLGYPVAIRGAIRLGLDYKYVLQNEKKLSSYNMESQGNLLADFYTLKYLNAPDDMNQKQYRHSLKLYEEVLHDFLKAKKAGQVFQAAILSMSLYLISHEACAWSRMAHAEVRLVNGMPCFSISKKEEKRNGIPQIGALNVSDISVKPAIKIWSFILPGADTIPVRASSCIRYGTAPASAETRPAPPLKTGRLYDVFLNGRPNDPADPTQGYVGKFCLAAKAGGGHELVVVTSDMREWRDDVCPAPSPLP